MGDSVKDLTGNPAVEEEIRKYYIKKKRKEEQNKVCFVEGVTMRERKRAQFTIDNSDLVKVSEEDLTFYNLSNEKAWKDYYKKDKARRKREGKQSN